MVDICQERLMESHKKSGLRKKAGSHRRLDEDGAHRRGGVEEIPGSLVNEGKTG
jgi:hypothetical protein